jgi:hypothetical protein
MKYVTWRWFYLSPYVSREFMHATGFSVAPTRGVFQRYYLEKGLISVLDVKNTTFWRWTIVLDARKQVI